MPLENETSDKASSKDDRAFQVMLYEWSARASAVAFSMVIPALIGLGIDLYFKTLPIGIISGTILGCVVGFWQLAGMARNNEDKEKK